MIQNRTPRRRAFTLIELLVVIAIIAILAAILFPVFAQAKLAAKKTAALSNMKQVATSLNIYLTDSDDTMPVQDSADVAHFGEEFVPAGFPGAGTRVPDNYLRGLLPYMKNRDILKSPAVTTEYAYADFKPTKLSDTNFMGNHAVISSSARVKSATVFEDPAGLIYTHEFRDRYNLAELRPRCNWALATPRCDYWHYSEGGVEFYSNNYGDSRRNEGGTNITFIDGHAKYRAGKSLKAKEFGLADYTESGGLVPSEDTWARRPDGGTWYRPMY